MKINIQHKEDRDNFIIALANNGYKSYVIVENDIIEGNYYYVIFEEEKS